MAKLSYNGMTWTVDHAVKGPDYVHGYSSDGSLVVALEHTTDFGNILYDGTYMLPEECPDEDCNVVIYANGSLMRRDGSKLSASNFGAAKATHYHDALDILEGVLGVARGGTGVGRHAVNAVLVGGGDNPVANVATKSGAFYATALNGAPRFGTLPIAQGGTGATTAAQAVKNLGCLQKVKLWENASPGSNFAAQTVSLDLSDYDGIEVIFRIEPSNDIHVNTGFTPKELRGMIYYGYKSGNHTHRPYKASDAGVAFEACTYSDSSASSSFCIPYAIYGIKGVS